MSSTVDKHHKSCKLNLYIDVVEGEERRNLREREREWEGGGERLGNKVNS